MSLFDKEIKIFDLNESKIDYGCKEVPDIKITLRDDNEEGYSIILDTIKDYIFKFHTNKEKREIIFDSTLINPIDYQVLVSKPYHKYIIETVCYWRSSETGKDELIQNPAMVFDNMELSYELGSDDDPAVWHFEFNNHIY